MNNLTDQEITEIYNEHLHYDGLGCNYITFARHILSEAFFRECQNSNNENVLRDCLEQSGPFRKPTSQFY